MILSYPAKTKGRAEALPLLFSYDRFSEIVSAAAASAAEDNEESDNDEPDQVVIEKIAKTVIHKKSYVIVGIMGRRRGFLPLVLYYSDFSFLVTALFPTLKTSADEQANTQTLLLRFSLPAFFAKKLFASFSNA